MKSVVCLSVATLVIAAWATTPLSQAAEGRSISNVNGSIRATAGQSYDSLSTVNGDVRVESGASADEARTVNGDIVLESETRLGAVKTVNGSLHLREGAAVARDISTVNGGIELGKRARVGGAVSTVSGDIEIDGAEVVGKLTTNNGDIDLTDGARVGNGIHVKKDKSWNWGWEHGDPVKVHVCSTCVVEGELRFDRPVELRVDQGGKIGNVIGESVTRR
jgi:DUF4097 and DUF4098 domain-containing protein YvlB